ncbi:hypothetical protein [Saccharopolyspora rosea]|uniref:Uncharacterized protein n=1 Tax=Saccharopolyspora rosea TaxID=524884 RepID=A0ABW3FWT1_9PSEU|nr:hypothetical protein [Saccharopolyspora rosea]
MSEIPRPLGPAELADERVEFLPARTVLTTVWFPIHTPNDLTVLHQVHHTHADPDTDDNISTGDVTGGNGGTGGGQGGGQGGGNGGNGGDGGSGGDGGDGGDGGNGIGGDGIGGAGIGGDGGGNIG